MARRPLIIAACAALALLLGGVGGIYVLSNQLFARTYEVPLPAIQVPVGDSEAIAEGERLGVIHGCVGCHTKTLGGKVAFNNELYQLNSANLTKGHGGVGNMSDGYLARAIRYGVRHDDRGVFGMPSATFYALDDVDLSLILAWARSKAPVPRTLGDHELHWKGRWALVTGALHSVGDSLSSAPKPPKAPPYGPTPEYGAYLARTICAECHGARLEGTSVAPALSVIAGYDSTQFENAIIYGQARDGRLLKFGMPIERYDALNPEEKTALYLYLHALRGPANW
ncbi:MAG TPA: c-type cytochrome [Gemmatimonadales bacterium]|nr:c-type cytochrome [Gemmatimonadales bacterium]